MKKVKEAEGEKKGEDSVRWGKKRKRLNIIETLIPLVASLVFGITYV